MTSSPSSRLSTASLLAPGNRQRGDYWCIPAGIENLLRCGGYSTISQEAVVASFVRQHVQPPAGADTLRESAGPTDFALMSDDEICRAFQRIPIPSANFGAFATVTNALLAQVTASRRLRVVRGLADSATYAQTVRSAIDEDEPILISLENPTGGFHIVAVLGYTPKVLDVYDPELDRVIRVDISASAFGSDCLILKESKT
ncbi:MAG: hypothetical protein DHS20C21_00670 [Gemmatimonadota bacterium]|nr:MAG: hypothetical protein DHS20C21_00670 [Gemmatimonadota bacterium]